MIDVPWPKCPRPRHDRPPCSRQNRRSDSLAPKLPVSYRTLAFNDLWVPVFSMILESPLFLCWIILYTQFFHAFPGSMGCSTTLSQWRRSTHRTLRYCPLLVTPGFSTSRICCRSTSWGMMATPETCATLNPKPCWMYGIEPHMTGTFWD